MNNAQYMDIALDLARQADLLGEVPVGAIIVKNDIIVGKGYNRRETIKNALSHAEIAAINDACKNLQSWRLSECKIYVTLEPCPMCMGAIINARIDSVIFGALDPKAGCCGSVIDLNAQGFNHKTEILGGINEAKCQQIINDFFAKLR